jgi:putative FmdB family regulatory protein
MPIYEYVCAACDHRTDILQGINDPGPNFCPSCGREGTMRKLIAAPAVHYKGSGWAKKDRGSSSARRSHASSSGEDGGSKDEKAEKAESAGKADRSDAGASKGTASTASSGGDD